MLAKFLQILMILVVMQNSLGSCSSEEQDLFNVAEQESVESAIAEASQNFANDIQRALLGRRHSALRRDVDGYTHIKLRDNVLNDSIYRTIAVKDVAITVISPVNILRFKPDIQNRIADVHAYWSEIVLAATFDNSETPNVTSNLIVSYNGASHKGKVGLQVNDRHFEASNFRLNVSYGSVDFWNVTSNNEKENVNFLRYDSAVAEIFRSYFNFEIRAIQEQILKTTLDDLLHNFPVSDIFNQSPQLQRSFRSLAGQKDETVNQLVDLILYIYRQHLIQDEKTCVQGPDLSTTFQEKIFGVPVTGTIAANNGFIGDLSSVYRTTSFSLDGNLTDAQFTLFGSLGLSNLNVKYNRYQIDLMTFHPEGSLSASVALNSIYFEVTANFQTPGKLTIKNYNIRVQELENIKVQVTGMGEAMDWIFSKIINWAIDSFRPKLVEAVQNNVRNIINSQLDKMGWQIPLS